MTGEIVEDNYVALCQGRRQAFLNVLPEDHAVHWAVDHQGCNDTRQLQPRDERRYFPISMWCVAEQSVTTFAAPMGAHHRGTGARLIEKNQFRWIKKQLFLTPDYAGFGCRLALLFRREQSFF